MTASSRPMVAASEGDTTRGFSGIRDELIRHTLPLIAGLGDWRPELVRLPALTGRAEVPKDTIAPSRWSIWSFPPFSFQDSSQEDFCGQEKAKSPFYCQKLRPARPLPA